MFKIVCILKKPMIYIKAKSLETEMNNKVSRCNTSKCLTTIHSLRHCKKIGNWAG